MKARKVKGLDPDGPLADNMEHIVEVRARKDSDDARLLPGGRDVD